MEKPTVFISHATVDSNAIVKLRSLLLDKTGGTIDFFVSSDGQSIPFGRNWVHEIESALGRASVMFVVLSPVSINSRWIPFEAGYAYAKGINVIPVGVFGYDLTKSPPPLSLLQGFNINKTTQLNNLIAILNTEFRHRHAESFTDDDFAHVFNAESPDLALSGTRYVSTLDLSLEYKMESVKVEKVDAILKDAGLQFVTDQEAFIGFGFDISYVLHGSSGEQFLKRIFMNLAPETLEVSLPLAFGLAGLGTDNRDPEIVLTARLREWTKVLLDNTSQSGRLAGSSITLASKTCFGYNGIEFSLDVIPEYYPMTGSARPAAPRPPKFYIELKGTRSSLTHTAIGDLINILVDRRIVEPPA